MRHAPSESNAVQHGGATGAKGGSGLRASHERVRAERWPTAPTKNLPGADARNSSYVDERTTMRAPWRFMLLVR